MKFWSSTKISVGPSLKRSGRKISDVAGQSAEVARVIGEALEFERGKTRGYRLNIPAGTAVRFEPGQGREVELVEHAGARVVYGFNARVMGALEKR